jgi:hypothetical protein
MNNSKELFETVMETQQKAMNSFVETANKFQEAMKSENPMEKSTEVYKNWWESQMAMFNNTTTEQKTENKVNETFEKSEEFFKNMYTAQLDAFKKAADFNLGMYNTLNRHDLKQLVSRFRKTNNHNFLSIVLTLNRQKLQSQKSWLNAKKQIQIDHLYKMIHLGIDTNVINAVSSNYVMVGNVELFL